jgi:DNA-binding MarR family transcriptional regulator
MAVAADPAPSLHAPSTVAALGIPEGLAEDLFLRRVMAERLMTVSRAADALAISHAVGDQLAESLRQKNLLEYQGVEGRDYRVSLTEAGRRLTTERMRSGHHVAPMPVPLSAYKMVVELQRSEVKITRAAAKKAFADLVIEDGLLDQIGPAFLSDGAIFFYGPPGTGKTSLAERMCRFYEDRVLVPRFIEVDGQLVSVFDPSVHEPVEDQPANLDPRYLLCKRPLIMAGGELTMSMMDLQYDPISGLSTAPIQLLANNGILVLDDFGRQTASPDEILNRWIVPLSRGVDFLRPNTGNKFTVPFELKLIISTNLDPHSLGDDAFLRRLRNKVFVGACSEAAFNWILVRAADRYQLQVTPEAAAYMSKITREQLGELRPYVANDLCELAVGVCQYDGLAHQLNERLIDRVASVYFVRSEEYPAPDTNGDKPKKKSLFQGEPRDS